MCNWARWLNSWLQVLGFGCQILDFISQNLRFATNEALNCIHTGQRRAQTDTHQYFTVDQTRIDLKSVQTLLHSAFLRRFPSYLFCRRARAAVMHVHTSKGRRLSATQHKGEQSVKRQEVICHVKSFLFSFQPFYEGNVIVFERYFLAHTCTSSHVCVFLCVSGDWP